MNSTKLVNSMLLSTVTAWQKISVRFHHCILTLYADTVSVNTQCTFYAQKQLITDQIVVKQLHGVHKCMMYVSVQCH